MMKRFAVVTLAWLALPAVAETSLMDGKVKTQRTVALHVETQCSPEEAYALWTTTEGVKQFFAPAARIDARPGGEYTILFLPDKDPQGLSHGTKGARVLQTVPGKAFSFEWITFAGDASLGRNAPPLAPRSLRDATPLPTWVELEFAPLAGDRLRTRVQLTHYGFKDDALWEESYRWFSRAWAGVLAQLDKYCADGR
ncbi:MAG TPA: SRPBCC domain-containing protein [Casimicrobiaceae bacterium]|nr:SRPBCC domain-containing protein [Casimicrobiaceae bacterium]